MSNICEINYFNKQNLVLIEHKLNKQHYSNQDGRTLAFHWVAKMQFALAKRSLRVCCTRCAPLRYRLASCAALAARHWLGDTLFACARCKKWTEHVERALFDVIE